MKRHSNDDVYSDCLRTRTHPEQDDRKKDSPQMFLPVCSERNRVLVSVTMRWRLRTEPGGRGMDLE